MEFGCDIIAMIRASYDEMTSVEKSIADFFIKEQPKEELTLQGIKRRIFVSEASLSRFAKRCGFKGFREFIYQYKLSICDRYSEYEESTLKVLEGYQTLYARTLRLINEDQLDRVVRMMLECKTIQVYGDGSSGFAAREFKARFMRMGLAVEAFTDDFLMMTNSVLMRPDTLAIGMSVSGKTRNTINSLHQAREHGAKTVLMTGLHSRTISKEFDEVLLVASYKELNTGINTSPQFPLTIMSDLLFSKYLYTNLEHNTEIYHSTQRALSYKYKE